MGLQMFLCDLFAYLCNCVVLGIVPRAICMPGKILLLSPRLKFQHKKTKRSLLAKNMTFSKTVKLDDC